MVVLALRTHCAQAQTSFMLAAAVVPVLQAAHPVLVVLAAVERELAVTE
jgi:hypothetical protein